MEKPRTERVYGGGSPSIEGRKFQWDGQPPRPIKKGEFYLWDGVVYRAYHDTNLPSHACIEIGSTHN